MEHTRGAMHCEWVALVDLVSFYEPVTGPSTRSPEVPTAAAALRPSIAISTLEQRPLGEPWAPRPEATATAQQTTLHTTASRCRWVAICAVLVGGL